MELSDDVHIIMFRPEIRCEKRKYLSRELPASLLARWAPKTCIMPCSNRVAVRISSLRPCLIVNERRAFCYKWGTS